MINLLEEVKNYLDITWDDEAGDKKISSLIKSGIFDIEQWAGVERGKIDFGTDKAALMILKDYVRYARSNALEEFEGNYIDKIIQLRERYGGRI